MFVTNECEFIQGMECNEIVISFKTCGEMVFVKKLDFTHRDNVGLLVSPLQEKVVNGKIHILLCNDIVDSVRIFIVFIVFRL